MSLLARLLAITFIESFATTLIERGIYFFSRYEFQFTDTENLGLALGFGAAYAAGAFSSHPIAMRIGEKRLIAVSLVGQFLAQAAVFAHPAPAVLVVGNTLLGALNGLKWPVIESYVSAGYTPRAQAAAVGRFNLSWAVAVPIGLASAGPLIAWWSPTLFAAGALMNVVSMVLVWPLAVRPAHLAADHPERPTPAQMLRYRCLLASSRCSMFASYSLMWVLAALLPAVFVKLEVGVTLATALAGLLDWFRTGTFLVLQLLRGWHNRAWPLVWVLVGLPVGFFVALFGPSLAVVLVGELIFGIAAGVTYYAALYYAMIVKNAAVEAGGAHEGLIGAGFVAGPAAGLVGGGLAPALGSPLAGMAAGMGPLIVGCAGGAVWFLAKCRPKCGNGAAPAPRDGHDVQQPQ